MNETETSQQPESKKINLNANAFIPKNYVVREKENRPDNKISESQNQTQETTENLQERNSDSIVHTDTQKTNKTGVILDVDKLFQKKELLSESKNDQNDEMIFKSYFRRLSNQNDCNKRQVYNFEYLLKFKNVIHF